MKKGVKYYSMLEPSGYGLSALSYIESLLEMGIQVYWTPLVQAEGGCMPWTWLDKPYDQVALLIEACVENKALATKLIHCLKPVDSYQRIVLHTVPEYWPQLIEPGGYHIGYTVWETTSLPRHFPALINQVKKVLVPAEFNQSVFRRSGVTVPIGVVPHILKSEARKAGAQLTQKQRKKDAAFVFYSINVWSARKALWSLLHCYLRAFTGDDSVELCLKTSLTGPAHELDSQVHDTDVLIQEIRSQYSNPATISVIRKCVTEQEIAALHQSGDCYISTTHSEGWGMGAFEAAGYGNPVIMTGWGGQLDFLSDELAYLINYRLVSVQDQRNACSYEEGQSWAAIDETHAIELMREVYLNQDSARQRANRLAIRLHDEFNSVSIGNRLYMEIFE